ncbi:MAG: ZIP family metal transporter [Cyanothece sp. SIO2G6]|nr:ZIP family metal transporter [Cyanothece sp. SIO2G6]
MEQFAQVVPSVPSLEISSIALPWDLPSGVVLSTLASLGTGLGSLPVLFTSRLGDRWRTLLFSVGSGVMIAAAAFSLLWPALSMATQGYDMVTGIGVVAIATLTGAALPYGIEAVLPEPEVSLPMGTGTNVAQNNLRGLWLFVMAIALHHLPEGLAVGLGTESTQDLGIALGIALQNVPEGLMVALALRELGYGIGPAMVVATVSGWLEPLGGLIGVILIDWSLAIAPIGMALAAGVMVFVVVRDLLPQLNGWQMQDGAYVGLTIGIAIMGMVAMMVS